MAQILGMNGFEVEQIIKVDIERVGLQGISGFETIAKHVGVPDLIVESSEVACFHFDYKQALGPRLMDLAYVAGSVWSTVP